MLGLVKGAMAPTDSSVPDPAASGGTDFDVAEVDRLLTTTKQVRKRLDLTRKVPREVLLECIDVAGHAPQGGNIQANNWMIIDEPTLIAKIGVCGSCAAMRVSSRSSSGSARMMP